jgi:hypothetical protein
MGFFGLDPFAGISAAFIQQRAKILPGAFACLFQRFASKVDENKLRLLAADDFNYM